MHVEDVAPDGSVDRLTGGWQVLSHRALDPRRTVRRDGETLQPFHPFTRVDQLGGVITLHHSARYPSRLVLPVR